RAWRGREGSLPGRRRLLLALPAVLGVAAALDAPWQVRLLAGVAAGGVVAVGLGWFVSADHHRQQVELMASWPHTWELLASCLRSGLPVGEACRAVCRVSETPSARVLGGVVARIDVGMSEADALLELREDPLVGRVVRDLARGLHSGTQQARTVAEHAAEARAAHHATLQERARSVGVRSVLPLMVCYLPAFVLVGVVPVVGGMVGTLLG
uniref:type II secretion system F family protein n=1 Tax=Desertihabitans aurantiacus TaxID=2282477 RepID=UPI000DF82C17